MTMIQQALKEQEKLTLHKKPMSKISLIVGLGNPGNEYTTTRHNVGWWFLDEFAKQNNINLKAETKFKGLYAKGGNDVHLIEPTTFMNRSGSSVVAITNFFKISPEQILVVHDDLDLPPGTIKLKIGGGHGGHNGLRSIISNIGSNEFLRIRIGIGHPGHRELVESFVLSRPSKSDSDLINHSISNCLYNIDDILSGNHQKVMQNLHTKN